MEQIAETEHRLGATFPAVFKMYVSRSNGDQVWIDDEVWFLFRLRDRTSQETLRRTAVDICYETESALTSNVGFPADGVAIAENGAGDWLLLRREGDRLGVAVWMFRLHGGELVRALDNVAELWER